LHENFNVGLHIIMSRHSPEIEYGDQGHYKYIAPMAFWYARAKIIAIDTPNEAKAT
jgi:hypothetical protein